MVASKPRSMYREAESVSWVERAGTEFMLEAKTRREIVISKCVVRLSVRQTPNLCALILWSKFRLAFSDVTITEEKGRR